MSLYFRTVNSSPKRVLIVDDQPDVRLAFRYMLEHYGYAVGEATNGADAILPKPISRDRLMQTIQSLTEGPVPPSH